MAQPRELTPEEVEALGLNAPAAPKELTPEQVAQLGLEAPTQEDPGKLRTLGHKLLQGFAKGFSDEAIGAITDAAVKPGEGAAWKDPKAMGGVRRLNTSDDVYKAGRDTERRDLAAMEDKHPFISFGAQAAGDIIGDALLKGAGVPGVGSKPYQYAMGALTGYGNSNADSTAGQVLDAGIGAGSAALANGLGRYVVGPLAQKAGPMLQRALGNKAVELGRRVLLNGADSLSTRAPVSAEAVQEAIRSGGIKPFSTTAATFKRLEGLASSYGDVYGAIIDELEKQGVKGPEAQKLADELVKRGAALERQTMNDALPQAYLQEAEKVLGKAGNEPKLGLSQAENLKRSLQDAARYGRVEETPLNEVKRDIASAFRQANEDAVDAAGQAAAPGSTVRELAEGFVPVKKRLGNLIEAREAARRGAARASQRSGSSLGDKIVGAAGMASGGPVTGFLYGAANNLVRNRGTSAMAVAADKVAQSKTLAAMLRGGARPVAGALPAMSRAEVDNIIAYLRGENPPSP